MSNPTISRDLLGKIVDEVFDGAIEDASVIEEIYAAIKRHESPSPSSQMVGGRYLNPANGVVFIFVAEEDGIVSFKPEGSNTLAYLGRDEFDRRFKPLVNMGVNLTAEAVIAMRDALIRKDVAEAYHQLYQAVDPTFCRYEPWVDTEAQLRSDHATQPSGIDTAVQYIEKRRDNYIDENGSYDPDTDVTKLPVDGEGYVAELDDLIEGIRALASTLPSKADVRHALEVIERTNGADLEEWTKGALPSDDTREALSAIKS